MKKYPADNGESYFSEVFTENVPGMLVKLCIVYTILALIGLLLVSPNPKFLKKQEKILKID